MTLVPELQATATIVVVDDDDDVRNLLARSLGAEGFRVEAAADGAQARTLIATEDPDLVVLDLTLPFEDGLDFLTELRAVSDVPVIVLTGRGAEDDRILGLKLGADDYLVKPFSAGELAARITTILRRARQEPRTPVFDFGELRIDLAGREVTVLGQPVVMTAKEFDLLAFLASSPRQVFGRDQLLHHVWASSPDWQDSATVTEHVRRIRRKIEIDPDRPRWVTTVRGVGYRFEP